MTSITATSPAAAARTPSASPDAPASPTAAVGPGEFRLDDWSGTIAFMGLSVGAGYALVGVNIGVQGRIGGALGGVLGGLLGLAAGGAAGYGAARWLHATGQ